MATLGVAFLLSGCLGGGSGEDDPSGARGEGPPGTSGLDWAARALDIESDHNHSDPADHLDLTTPNFELLGYDPLVSEYYGSTAYGNFCGDAAETTDGRRLAVVESRSDVAFTLADVTDPMDPKYLGELVMSHDRVYDLAVVPDGRHVVLVTSQSETSDRDPTPPLPKGEAELRWRSPCAPGGEVVVRPFRSEDPIPRPSSLLLVSIEDPSAPAIVDQRPIPGFGHSVFSTILEGRTWVLASTYAQTSGASSFEFYEILESAGPAVLNHLATYALVLDSTDPDEITLSLGHNDGWITVHPGTGQTVAWLALWDSGILVLDLADPMRPELIGRWNDFDPNGGLGDTGKMHSVYAFPELRDGRHYIVIGPELVARPENFPTGIIHVLDTTDPTSPVEVAAWTLPYDVTWSGTLMFSTHYLTVVNETLFVSMYHGGIWAIDLSTVGSAEFVLLDSIGVFMPAETSPNPPEVIQRWFPTMEEVLSFPDGVLVTFDANVGIYTLRFDDSNPMPAPEPWPITAAGV